MRVRVGPFGRGATLVILTLSVAGGMAGCSSSGTSSASSGVTAPVTLPPRPGTQADTSNTQDAIYALQQTNHNSQAIELASLVPSRSTTKSVEALAERIKAFAEATNTSLEAASMNLQGDMGQSMVDMQSFPIPANQIKKIKKAAGAGFDRQWAAATVTLNDASISIINTELEFGESQDIRTIAAASDNQFAKFNSELASIQ